MITFEDIMGAVQRQEAKELSALCLQLWGEISFLRNVPKSRQKRVTKAATDPPKETWLTPAFEVWREMVGAPNGGRMGKALSPLLEHYQPDEIGTRLRMYLLSLKMKDELRFASVERFASTINLYNPHEPAFEEDA